MSDDNNHQYCGDNPVLSGKVLVLNQSYEPLCLTSPKKAIILLYLLKADLVISLKNRVIHSVNTNYPFPSVIKLNSYFRIPYKKIELSRRNIIKRDNGICQYCGKKASDMTVDHIMPKSRGGSDSWENLVAACNRCNNRKGNRTPDEADMKLLHKPKKPHHIFFLRQNINKLNENWKPFLFLE